jgi:hypothetical protein
MPFKCKFCGERFCGEHRLPENHDCAGLENFKKERRKGPEKWIYEPFKSRKEVAAGRKIKRPVSERILSFLYGLDSRKILYGILIIIVLLTLSKL